MKIELAKDETQLAVKLERGPFGQDCEQSFISQTALSHRDRTLTKRIKNEGLTRAVDRFCVALVGETGPSRTPSR